MKPKVLITRKILPEALDYLKEHIDYEIGSSERALTKEEIIEKIKDKEGLLSLLVDTIDKKVIDSAPSLRIIANCAVGYNNIDINHAQKKKIHVTNTPGVLTETTADLTWALILAVARKIPQSDKFTKEKKYRGWELELFLGKEVTGKRLGIIGMGRIGKAVASRAQAFRMEIVYFDPFRLSPAEEKKYNASPLPLDELLSSSEIITIHAALTPQTFHLISKEKIELINKDAILINAARGPIVDEKALAEALERRQIWGAGLDVYEREPDIEEKLLTLDNAILLPHIGSATYETRLKMAMIAARNLVQGLKGERPDNLVV
ncbi:MAG: D-glycerate dehydrogenase [Candidatus Aminicenantes bacterium]|nr:MAG: D-glycerate dehydrogenase [Candidatus Aminicenantes bacterium]